MSTLHCSFTWSPVSANCLHCKLSQSPLPYFDDGVLVFNFLYNSKVVILLSQKMLHSLLRQPLWNMSILLSTFISYQKYSTVVFMLYFLDIQLFQSWKNTPWAFPSLAVVSFCVLAEKVSSFSQTYLAHHLLKSVLL